MFKVTNNAVGVLGSSIDAIETSVGLAVGHGARFPALGAGDWFPVTVVKASDPSQFEIMRCTARSGDTLTVARGQESTTAIAFDPGDVAELRFTAAAIEEFIPKDGGVANGLRYSIEAPVPAGGAVTLNLAERQIFTITASSPLDATFTNLPAGVSMGILLNIEGSSVVTVTNAELRWDEGGAPVMGDTWTQLAFLWDGTNLTGSLRASL